MWGQYDENLGENPFFREIQDSHGDIVEKSSKENWTICVPRLGTLEVCDISMETILDHILVPQEEQTYCSLSKKRVGVKDKHIQIEASELFTNNVEILFEETFYVDKARYTVWCLDRPLFAKRSVCESSAGVVLENVHDCIDFLWAESFGHGILDSIKQLCYDFKLPYEEFETESLQTQKEHVGNLYSQCLQVGLKSEVIRDKSAESTQFLDKFKVSVETYMQYCLRRKLVFSVSTLQHQTDSVINKVIRNSGEVQYRDLGISDRFLDVITLAKCELNKINNYITILDKLFCLKRTFDVIYEVNKAASDICITSDDLLQILVFLILKLNVTNWSANLVYLKEFRLSLFDSSDQNSFFVTTLEAAVEFIKSNKFMEISNKCVRSSVYSSTSMCKVFEEIKSGRIVPQSSPVELCHPLCACDACESLDDVGYSPTKLNDRRQSLLVIAALLDDCDVVEFLLGEHLDVNFSDYLGRTSLHYAASRGFQDVLLLLINAGADVNALDNEKNTALHLACNNGHDNCVKALIYSSGQVELNVGNFFGDTPLHLATKWGYLEIVRILLENGASIIVPNKRNQTIVHLAPNYYVLKLFQEFGVERSATLPKHIKDVSGIASVEEKCHVVDCTQYGVTPKTVDQLKRTDLLLKAVENNDLPLTCFYLGFSCNASKQSSRNACHPLCDCDNCLDDQDIGCAASQTLQAAKVNTCNTNGHTPLHVAAKFGRTDILRLLLDCGALPNVRTYKTLRTPLHLACVYQRVETVRELLKCGDCKVDVQDAKGNTALYYACINNDVKLVELLLLNGADCTKRNYSGHSALQQSEESMQYKVFKLLKNSLLGRDGAQTVICGDGLF